jgi:putative oxidoreductase
METVKRLQKSLNSKVTLGYALIRIFLGIALLVRGWMIVTRPSAILDLGVEQQDFMWVALVGIAHLLGGILLTIGFLTRLGALMQIPILFSATFFVYAHTKLMMGGQSFELASLVLFLLIVYFIYGSGPLSVREYLERKKA